MRLQYLRLALMAAPLLAQTSPVNLGFDEGEPGQPPSGWFLPGPSSSAGYSAVLSRDGCRSGLCATITAPAQAASIGFGTLMQSFDAAAYRGKRVRLRCWLRLDNPGPGDQAQAWMRVDVTGGQTGFFDNMQDRPVRADQWTLAEIEGPIDPDARALNFGVISIGKARIWMDSFSLEVVEASEPPAEDPAEVAAVREALAEIYAGIDRAYSSGRIDALAALSLPDARVVAPTGQSLPVGDVVAELRQVIASGIQISTATTIVSVRLQRDEAVATIETQQTMTSAGGTQSYLVTSRDTWVQTPDGWRLRASQSMSTRPLVPPVDAAVAKQVVADLKSHAVPLTSVTAGAGFDDLAAFGEAVGDARIVALGEASHGTREFFQMKHRLLEYLVREKGFTVFAIEANWPESLAVDRYVKTGEGNPKVGLGGMYFWTWNTEEVLAMIEWMRAFNEAPGQHPTLTFTSFDMQTPRVAAMRALDYLRRVSPEDAAAAETSLNEAAAITGTNRTPEAAKGAADGMAAVIKRFDERRAALEAKSSPEEWKIARQAAEVARQAVTLAAPESGPDYRDRMMARNVEWLAREMHPDEKIVLWAHNGHVSSQGQMSLASMGSSLRETFGADLHVVGFAFRRGAVRAVARGNNPPRSGLSVNTVPPVPEGTGSAVLGDAGLPLFYLDLRSVPQATALGRWLGDSHLFVDVGAMWNTDGIEGNLRPVTLSASYDSLIFIEESHASVALPRIQGAGQ